MEIDTRRERALVLRAYAETKTRLYGDQLRALARELEDAAVAEERASHQRRAAA